jgi:hypothetical protein
MRFWPKRRPKHRHEWVNLGYGGAGWHLIQCATCGEKEIA